jgi:hypothetical protein
MPHLVASRRRAGACMAACHIWSLVGEELEPACHIWSLVGEELEPACLHATSGRSSKKSWSLHAYMQPLVTSRRRAKVCMHESRQAMACMSPVPTCIFPWRRVAKNTVTWKKKGYLLVLTGLRIKKIIVSVISHCYSFRCISFFR